MKPMYWIIGTVSVLLLSIAVGFYVHEKSNAKTLYEIKKCASELDGSKVKLHGIAYDATDIPFSDRQIFILRDGEDEIYIYANSEPIKDRDRVIVTGILKSGLKVFGKNIGLHIEATELRVLSKD